jgi:S1-C subfamily serine protease
MASRQVLTSRLLFLLAVVCAVEFGSIRCGAADATNGAALDASVQPPPPGVGTIDDYVGQRGGFGIAAAPARAEVPLLGITVFRDRGKLASGEELDGLAVTSVDKLGPGYKAGIRAQRIEAKRAAEEVGATVLVLGAAAFFPPTLFVVPMLARMPSTKTYDVIVAIDAQRIEDVEELESSLRNATAGETIYLTIIRDGQRLQLRMPMPDLVSASASSVPKN